MSATRRALIQRLNKQFVSNWTFVEARIRPEPNPYVVLRSQKIIWLDFELLAARPFIGRFSRGAHVEICIDESTINDFIRRFIPNKMLTWQSGGIATDGYFPEGAFTFLLKARPWPRYVAWMLGCIPGWTWSEGPVETVVGVSSSGVHVSVSRVGKEITIEHQNAFPVVLYADSCARICSILNSML